ncbi:MAG: hypothetical protein H0W44_01230 [Gammaproteobacteria bacterium]|nr:hypothetical protein [Gammaproteobacteria bacterium]
MRGIIPSLSLILASSFLISAPTQAARVAVHASGGTLGIGPAVTVGLSRSFNVRAGLGSLDADKDFTEDDINYTATYELDSRYALLDWHPMGWKVRLTAGLVNIENGINLQSNVPSLSAQIGDNYYNQDVDITGRLTLADGTYPYFGIGFGNAVSRGIPFGFGIDIGVIKQDTPEADISVNSPQGLVSESDIQKEESELNEEFKGLDLWPVLNMSVSYRF